jgi:hypothetical protein
MLYRRGDVSLGERRILPDNRLWRVTRKVKSPNRFGRNACSSHDPRVMNYIAIALDSAELIFSAPLELFRLPRNVVDDPLKPKVSVLPA